MYENLPDHRRPNGHLQHSLIEIVFIVLCSTVAGRQSWTDIELFARSRIDWFRRFLKLPPGIPSHDTIDRVLAGLDTASFQACLHDWIERLYLDLQGQGIHIGGKTLRHSFDAATNQQSLHMVSA
ncbi:MAG TPA: ISAs1 family transposase [Pirellulaceae bacterium]|nr:ISAs1 family transposase [Pirellulaceae bacterium]HMO90754.1 ISAs1 family transposase [Pirellulaceae bacterium]HMP68005.1 ISAs1 family transposase [Pirellulaceae bacterium]